MKIKKGDFIKVISGKYKETKGQIVRIDHQKNFVFLEEIKSKKHRKPTQEQTKGKIEEILRPINVSNVMALDPKKKVITKIGYKFVNNKKVRFAKKNNLVYKN